MLGFAAVATYAFGSLVLGAAMACLWPPAFPWFRAAGIRGFLPQFGACLGSRGLRVRVYGMMGPVVLVLVVGCKISSPIQVLEFGCCRRNQGARASSEIVQHSPNKCIQTEPAIINVSWNPSEGLAPCCISWRV